MTVTVVYSSGDPVNNAGVEIYRFTGTEYTSWGTGFTNQHGECTMSYPTGGKVKVYANSSCVYTGNAGNVTVRV
jgi:5-hydroxyisourate hydrolase-like protein (transthyretin family)